jgi:hypothetical protein
MMMINKALIEVAIPAAEKKFDVFIPYESRMSEVKQLITAAMSDLTEGKFSADATAVLCDAESGIIYDVNMIVSELGIKNGSKIMLI